MNTFTFSGLGTKWSVSIDGGILRNESQKAILLYAETFEKRFSRFLPESEVNAWRDAQAGTYSLSSELALLLAEADRLRKLTHGAYDPALGKLLEHAGYDPEYRLQPNNQQVEKFCLPKWSVINQALTIDGPVVFDLGGIGKGYCIDQIAIIIEHSGYVHFLIEGGGDMYGTTKADKTGFRVALEWPGRPGRAFGIIELKHQGLAVSDSFKRHFGDRHHIINPQTKQSIQSVIGCTALAKTAWQADCMTSGLFLASLDLYPRLAETLEAEYVVFRNDQKVLVSSYWPGELF